MLHEYTQPCFKSIYVTTKFSIITSVVRRIFFVAKQNSKLVTTRRSTSQLVMPHECTHPRYVTIINFNHYICNTIYIFHRNLKFKARQSTSRHVAARHAAWIYASTLYVTTTKFNHYICNAPYIFHCNTKFKARHSISIITSVLRHIFFT
jgi:hypothetical protein